MKAGGTCVPGWLMTGIQCGLEFRIHGDFFLLPFLFFQLVGSHLPTNDPALGEMTAAPRKSSVPSGPSFSRKRRNQMRIVLRFKVTSTNNSCSMQSNVHYYSYQKPGCSTSVTGSAVRRKAFVAHLSLSWHLSFILLSFLL